MLIPIKVVLNGENKEIFLGQEYVFAINEKSSSTYISIYKAFLVGIDYRRGSLKIRLNENNKEDIEFKDILYMIEPSLTHDLTRMVTTLFLPLKETHALYVYENSIDISMLLSDGYYVDYDKIIKYKNYNNSVLLFNEINNTVCSCFSEKM